MFNRVPSLTSVHSLMCAKFEFEKKCFQEGIHSPCPNGNAGSRYQRTGNRFSTLRRQMGCGSRLFSIFLAYIYKKYIAHGRQR